jgi:hypothetical protein
MSEMDQVMLNLRITVNTQCGETEDEVYKHICNLLYDREHDIVDIEEIVG